MSPAQTVVYTWTVDVGVPTLANVPVGSDLGCNPASGVIPSDASVKAVVTASDTCSAATVSVSHADTTSGCVTTRTFTITASDLCGNVSPAQTVVYTWTVDVGVPTLANVPVGSDLGCNPASGVIPSDASVKAVVTASDTCSAATVSVSHADTTSGCVTTRTFTITASDLCGNVSPAQTVVYTWTVDVGVPTLANVPVGSDLGCNPASGVIPSDASVKAVVTASDTCSAATVTVNHADTTSGCVTTRTFTITASDLCGNVSPAQTVVYTWTVDVGVPTLANVPVGSDLGCNPASGVIPSDASVKAVVTASDTCSAATVTCESRGYDQRLRNDPDLHDHSQ